MTHEMNRIQEEGGDLLLQPGARGEGRDSFPVRRRSERERGRTEAEFLNRELTSPPTPFHKGGELFGGGRLSSRSLNLEFTSPPAPLHKRGELFGGGRLNLRSLILEFTPPPALLHKRGEKCEGGRSNSRSLNLEFQILNLKFPYPLRRRVAGGARRCRARVRVCER
jgi:hypothetical protein